MADAHGLEGEQRREFLVVVTGLERNAADKDRDLPHIWLSWDTRDSGSTAALGWRAIRAASGSRTRIGSVL